ncbi:thioredoxin [Mariniphaga anaerophila]|uniref:Thioredoxin n=1 Tax=Mariniphaga anaerophila TaxID=1484053 RepID=A0A1M4VSV6_9BACT|nr:thioredoxin domain-containing protein [Mariniphaga anaerophila]SHE72116.1 thioredoxin [Mariniphaga anaerophila]
MKLALNSNNVITEAITKWILKQLFLILFFVGIVFSVDAQEFKNVGSKTFSQLIKTDAGIILDVRTPDEFSRGHIEGATNMDSESRELKKKLLLLSKEVPIYIYCLSGDRSRDVARVLTQNGYAKVYNLRRGTIEWRLLGYPLIKEKNAKKITDIIYSTDDFDKILKEHNIVFVDFFAPWCAPCKKMMPDIEKLEKEYAGKVKIVKANLEANNALAHRYHVESVPTLMLFSSGVNVFKKEGIMAYGKIKELLDESIQ